MAILGTIEGLNEDFRDLLVALGREGVEFLIVGAYAIAFHGVPRTTGDIDIFVRPSAENAARVWRALVAFGAPLEANAARESDFAEPGIVYQIGLPPRRIDRDATDARPPRPRASALALNSGQGVDSRVRLVSGS